MRWKPESFSADLAAAVNTYNHSEAERLCESLVVELRKRATPYPKAAAKDDLATLRKKRHFHLMAKVADAHLRAGLESYQIKRQYAQAMLDRGDVTGALPMLREIADDPKVTPKERAEAIGLIGRARKQIYMDAQVEGGGRGPKYRDALLGAFGAYHSIYMQDRERHVWQGINAASLLARAMRDGVDTSGHPEPREIAEHIRDTIRERTRDGEASMWDLACIAEAYVALALLGDPDAAPAQWKRAAKALKDYAEHKKTDAFELAATLRQYEQVWQLDKDQAEEAVLLDMLRGELLQASGGEMTMAPGQLRETVGDPKREEKLQALLGSDKYKSHTWLMRCLKRAQGVARIWKGTRGIGSGFLVPGEALADRWKGQQILVTNNHVIATEPRLSITIPPGKAEITFDALHDGKGEPPRYGVSKVLKESLFDDLDFTCIRLDKEIQGIEDYETTTTMPDVAQKERIYVIGHPLGGELSYSIQDNAVLGMNEKFVHYRSPTEKGSSGSPLFDDQWRLIGLHHAGSKYMERLDDPDETYEANEGIPLKAIRDAVK